MVSHCLQHNITHHKNIPIHTQTNPPILQLSTIVNKCFVLAVVLLWPQWAKATSPWPVPLTQHNELSIQPIPFKPLNGAYIILRLSAAVAIHRRHSNRVTKRAITRIQRPTPPSLKSGGNFLPPPPPPPPQSSELDWIGVLEIFILLYCSLLLFFSFWFVGWVLWVPLWGTAWVVWRRCWWLCDSDWISPFHKHSTWIVNRLPNFIDFTAKNYYLPLALSIYLLDSLLLYWETHKFGECVSQ